MAVTCAFEEGYRDYDGSSASATCSRPATVYVWFKHDPSDQYDTNEAGTVVALCEDHVVAVRADAGPSFDVANEIVPLASLSMTCSACGDPVWASHAEGHATGQRCDFCQASEADHPACSCPVEAEYLRAMVESEMADHQ